MAFATKVNGPDFDELVRSKLKIFLSVDVVGSTALKQQGRKFELPDGIDDGPEFVNGDWLRFLTNFYRDFPSKLADAFSEIRERRSTEDGTGDRTKPPLMWKALGDELIFSAELKAIEDAAIHLESLATAINSSVRFWTQGSSPLPISFKGTAWIAGFPVGNSEIPMVRESGNSNAAGVSNCIGDDHYDYSGPAMDVGFRLAKFATPRRLIISSELADLVIADSHLGNHFRASEPVELKGVLRGRPYPILWFDCYSITPHVNEKTLADREDELLQRRNVQTGTAQAYLQAWFKTIDDCFLRPFIYGLPVHKDRIPADYEHNLASVVNQLERIYKPASEDDGAQVSAEGDEKATKLESLLPPEAQPRHTTE